jgi:hypothetical protein
MHKVSGLNSVSYHHSRPISKWWGVSCRLRTDTMLKILLIILGSIVNIIGRTYVAFLWLELKLTDNS